MKRYFSFAVALCSVLGQESIDHYDALKQALRLNDSQIRQLQQQRVALGAMKPPANITSRRAGSSVGYRLLDESQKAALGEIEKVLHRSNEVSQAIELGIIDAARWPGATLCYYPIHPDAVVFGLRESQVRELEQLSQEGALHPQREMALAVLDDAQKANLAAFGGALQLATEAIELGLIPDPPKGEVLCH